MTFTPEQAAMLAADLDKRHVMQRQQGRGNVSYVTSWHVLNEANRIFGFDGWQTETIETRLVAEHETTIGKDTYAKKGWAVSYIAKVRVTVLAGSSTIIREGVGSGHGIDVSLGNAHESAIKEAESDARKRALITFGNPFGLALYDKQQRHVSDGVDDAPPAEPARQRNQSQARDAGDYPRIAAEIWASPTVAVLADVWKRAQPILAAMPDSWQRDLTNEKNLCKASLLNQPQTQAAE